MAKHKTTNHPGFDSMVHKGDKHPGFKSGAKKAMAPPMPAPGPQAEQIMPGGPTTGPVGGPMNQNGGC